MDVTFSVRADGQVDVHLADGWKIFQDALDDSISSLPPRGASGNGPSAHWVAPGTDLASVAQPGIGAAIWQHATDVQAIHDALVADGHTIVSAPVDGPFGRTFTFHDRACSARRHRTPIG